MADDKDDEGIDFDEGEQSEKPEEQTEDDGPILNAEGKPATKKDWDALQEALKKARRDARAAKRHAVTNGAQGQTEGQESKSPEDVEREVRTKLEAEYKPVLIRSAVDRAFARAGIKEDRFDRAFRLLDLEDLTLSEDRKTVEGLEEQIAELKEDIPELFIRRRTSSVDSGDRSAEGNGKKLTPSEMQARALLGK